MTNVILFDNEVRDQLLPLTFLQPVAELRLGILTIREKWERYLGLPVSWLTQDYLSEKYPLEFGEENLLINASILPTPSLVRLLQKMDTNQAFLYGEELVAASLSGEQMEELINDEDFGNLNGHDLEDMPLLRISRPHDLFTNNARAIELDFQLLTGGRESAELPKSNTLIGPREKLFIEEGARVEASIINTEAGHVYIGRDAEIMEGCMVRGPLAMCEGSVLKMGAKVYGPTTLGPVSKFGGEINNVVVQGYSNKAHDGFLGNSVIGQWCNIGADTNCSNLKNTYDEVRLWSYPEERFVSTGLQFCGLIMGDHSKVGINTMFNTGTVVGICSNVFGAGFPRNFIPSFAWGGVNGFTTFRANKAFDMIERVMARRNMELTTEDRLILLRVYEETVRFRRWEKESS